MVRSASQHSSAAILAGEAMNATEHLHKAFGIPGEVFLALLLLVGVGLPVAFILWIHSRGDKP